MPKKKTTKKDTKTKKTTKKPAVKVVAKKNESKKNVSVQDTKVVIKTSKKDVQSDEKVLLTKEGLQNLRDELNELKHTKRKKVAERLQEAISYGDLSENAEYEEAKNEQAFCEGRIAELEKMIKNAELIKEDKVHKALKVRIGTTVIIKNLTKEEDNMEFTIVGSTEADPFAFRISNESPIGKNLIGKQKGDKFQVEAPGGVFDFQLMEIK